MASFLLPRPHLLQATATPACSPSPPSASLPFFPALLHPDHHHHHRLSFSSSFSATWRNSNTKKRPSLVRFALAGSEQPNSLEQRQQEALRPLLQELADSFALPNDYFQQLPRDLRLDLNDAAFDLSQGPVIEECGQELGEMLLNLSRAWELADTATSSDIVSKLPALERLLTDSVKSAFGRRLVSAGRRYESMGQYGQGELQRIAKALSATGKALSASPVTAANEMPKAQSRVLKFGELQVELTPKKAYVGAVIGLVFGILSWELGQGVLSIQESSLEYANDNALLLAKSLRGSLLALCFASAFLSAFASIGLILLGRQLDSKDKS
ncbi:uncharacterized protein LOC116266296 [Nymphaea colorata]|nr:uncharacterized protein LOC116266296 [Nymphaea colorata]